ncbi:MAG TPA: hypothetical protein VKS25_11845 [Solirubrobacteraceae bacterium]|nr:hypothetical protein [Solirubrobacteraceae bacterium]
MHAPDEDAFAALRDIVERRGQFGHAQHLELAWTCLRSSPFEQAAARVDAAIRRFAVLHGASDRFHGTITRAWLRVVEIHMTERRAASFDDFIAAYPALLNKDLLARHYSAELLSSEQARVGWVDPDVRAFPA